MKQNKCYYFIIFISFNLFLLPVKSDPIFDLGKNVFLNKGACSTCHILADAGSDGQIGPNLNEVRPGIDRILNAVKNGIGVMPMYEGELTPEEIEAVVHYVFTSANN